MEWYWIISIAAILLFCLVVFYRISFIRGYRAGARMVLKEWKEELYLKEGNDEEIGRG